MSVHFLDVLLLLTGKEMTQESRLSPHASELVHPLFKSLMKEKITRLEETLK